MAVKLAIVIALVVSGAMGLLGSVIVYKQTQLLSTQMQVFGNTVTRQMADTASEPLLADDDLALQLLAANLAQSDGVVGTAVFDADGALISQAGIGPFQLDAPHAGRAAAFLGNRPDTLEWDWPDAADGPVQAISFIRPVEFQGLTVGHVLISFSRSTLNQSLRDSVQAIVGATVLMILFGMIVSYLVGRRLSRPIRDLVDASQAIDAGRYGYRITERRNDELGMLMSGFNNMAAGLLRKNQVEQIFSRYVSPRVAREILSNLDNVELGGKHVEGTVLFADIVGFTSLSERLVPGMVAELLNEYFTYITRAAEPYNGTVDKFIGDCAMLVFGVPDKDPDQDFNAIACAVVIQDLMAQINARRRAKGSFPVQFRIGINSGVMLAGNMGSKDRMAYTVVGDAVNLASRLCSIANPDQIVITEEIYKRPTVCERIIAEQHEPIRIRGKAEPVTTYHVTCLREPYAKIAAAHVARLLDQSEEADL